MSAANVISVNDSGESRLRSLVTLISVLIGLVYLSLDASGLGVSAAQMKKEDKVTSPLELRLILPATDVCLNSQSITLEVEMKNTGKQPITIDQKFLWNGSISIDYREENNEIVDGWLSDGNGSYPYKGDFIKIEPGHSNKVSHQLSLLEADKSSVEFFGRVGKFTMQLRYQAYDWDEVQTEIKKWLYTDPIISNRIEFQVISCQ
jgi:archaellum component FlaF (FlaF/FlaG flagellin family)